MSVEKYEADDDELCEFMEEPDDSVDSGDYETEMPLCQKKAQYLVVETTVEDHLCSGHVAKTQTEDADADLFAESIGLGSSTMVPIDGDYTGTCEYFDPLNPSPERCMQRATHARVLEFETLFCEEHLKEYQDELEP